MRSARRSAPAERLVGGALAFALLVVACTAPPPPGAESDASTEASADSGPRAEAESPRGPLVARTMRTTGGLVVARRTDDAGPGRAGDGMVVSVDLDPDGWVLLNGVPYEMEQVPEVLLFLQVASEGELELSYDFLLPNPPGQRVLPTNDMIRLAEKLAEAARADVPSDRRSYALWAPGLRAARDEFALGRGRLEDLEAIPPAMASPEVNGALYRAASLRTELRLLRNRYADDYPPIQELLGEIAAIETQEIPRVIEQVLTRLEAPPNGA